MPRQSAPLQRPGFLIQSAAGCGAGCHGRLLISAGWEASAGPTALSWARKGCAPCTTKKPARTHTRIRRAEPGDVVFSRLLVTGSEVTPLRDSTTLFNSMPRRLNILRASWLSLVIANLLVQPSFAQAVTEQPLQRRRRLHRSDSRPNNRHSCGGRWTPAIMSGQKNFYWRRSIAIPNRRAPPVCSISPAVSIFSTTTT